MHVTEQKSNYDMIIGRDILSELGINLNFKDMTVQWDTAVIPMKEMDSTIEISYAVEDSEAVHDATERIKRYKTQNTSLLISTKSYRHARI